MVARRPIRQFSPVKAHPTLLGPRTRITNGLLSLMGCILPTIHCRSQHCWEVSHLFAHHCQHRRNNSHHCWPNNVGSCCVRLHVALGNLSNDDDGFMSKQQLSTSTLFQYISLTSTTRLRHETSEFDVLWRK